MNGKLTVGSLFSGIGGLELGLERTGHFETRWQCEINEYARKVLAKNWPGLPIYNDIKELYESEFPEYVDVLCGGFPCQPFSTAGKRRGESDERFLWPEFVRVVREVRPRWVIAENVPGLLTIDSGRVFGRILGDLASCGYDAEWDTISAASVGALHPRNRIFIVGRLADANGSMPGIHPGAISEAPGDLRRGAPSDLSPGCGQVLADPHIQGLEGRRSYRESTYQRAIGQGGSFPDASGEGRQCRQSGYGRFDPQCGEGIPGRSGSGNAPNTQGSGFLRTKELENDSGHQRERRGPDITERDSIFRVRPRPTTDWATEPDVGGGSDGFPDWMDRHIGRGLSYAESRRRTEVLRGMWSPDVAEKIWRTIGGLDRVQAAEVLFAFVRQYEGGTDQAWIFLESQEASEGPVREMRRNGNAGCPPYQWGPNGQPTGEHNDDVCSLPCSLPSWEFGISRVASGIPSRVDRLRCLGNAVVPQCAEYIGERILEWEGLI